MLFASFVQNVFFLFATVRFARLGLTDFNYVRDNYYLWAAETETMHKMYCFTCGLNIYGLIY